MEALDAYEALRPRESDRWRVSGGGAVLLIRDGMVAWLRAWKTCQAPSPLPKMSLGPPPVLTEDLRNPLIPVLARLVRTYQQEV